MCVVAIHRREERKTERKALTNQRLLYLNADARVTHLVHTSCTCLSVPDCACESAFMCELV